MSTLWVERTGVSCADILPRGLLSGRYLGGSHLELAAKTSGFVAKPLPRATITSCIAAGVSNDFPLAMAYAYARTVRIVDGPEEVHRNQIARLELRKYEAHG